MHGDDEEFFERYGMACEGVMITSGMMFLIMFAKRAGIPDEALRATFEQQLAAAGAIEGACARRHDARGGRGGCSTPRPQVDDDDRQG
jgi:hypothetical protein